MCGPGDVCPEGLVCSTATHTCETSNIDIDGGITDEPCATGYEKQAGECVDVDECAGAHDCASNATCANEPGTFSCACNPGFAGDGRTCSRVCASVLIYDDCTGPTDADCASIQQAQFADNAAMGLGIQVKFGTTGNQAMFRTLFDAGDFDVLVFESSLSNLEQDTANRVATWVSGGGKAIISFWDLDNDAQGQTIRNAAQVTTSGAAFGTPRDVVLDPASTVNFFAGLEQVPLPLSFRDLMVDDGDELSTANGFIAARHTNATGAGAIAVTRNDRVITLGFLPVGMVFQGPRDADDDGKPDVQELYTNLLGYLCGY